MKEGEIYKKIKKDNVAGSWTFKTYCRHDVTVAVWDDCHGFENDNAGSLAKPLMACVLVVFKPH